MMNNYGYYPMDYGNYGGGDGISIVGLFLTILFWVLVIYLVINIVRWLRMTSVHGHDWHNHWRDRKEMMREKMYEKGKNYDHDFERTGNYMKDNTALDILKERYAKGEISKMQYEDMKRDLTM